MPLFFYPAILLNFMDTVITPDTFDFTTEPTASGTARNKDEGSYPVVMEQWR